MVEQLSAPTNVPRRSQRYVNLLNLCYTLFANSSQSAEQEIVTAQFITNIKRVYSSYLFAIIL